MNVNEAVRAAADYVSGLESLFNPDKANDFNETLQDLRFAVEGTKFNEENRTWVIEVGFTRPWNKAPRNGLAGLSGAVEARSDIRTEKQVVISDETGKVVFYGD